jgi:hypothetical protein
VQTGDMQKSDDVRGGSESRGPPDHRATPPPPLFQALGHSPPRLSHGPSRLDRGGKKRNVAEADHYHPRKLC